MWLRKIDCGSEKSTSPKANLNGPQAGSSSAHAASSSSTSLASSSTFDDKGKGKGEDEGKEKGYSRDGCQPAI